jgi:hypothetical protein
MGREINPPALGQRLFQTIQIGIDLQVNMRPIIQTGSFEITICQVETQRFNEMQRGVCGSAGSCDTSGVLRYLRLM